MWSVLKIYLGLGLLTIYVHGYDRGTIQKAWHEDQLIDGIFQPLDGETIIDGGFSLFFAGVNLCHKNFVSLKISFDKEDGLHEYKMYSYLKAKKRGVEVPELEQYGISAIYYFNQHIVGSLTALSLFECNLYQKKTEPKFQFVTNDYLILFRNFVRQIKYVHSCGILHGNVNPYNIMLRKGRSFLTDFSQSSIMITLDPFADWKNFILTMALIVNDDRTCLQKISAIHNAAYKKLMLDTVDLGVPHKLFIDQTIENIKCDTLKAVMVKFATEAYKRDGSLPNYDVLDGFITSMIGDDERSALFSWLKDDATAIKDLQVNRPKTAKEIGNPKAVLKNGVSTGPSDKFLEEEKTKMAKKATKNRESFKKEIDEKLFEFLTEKTRKVKLYDEEAKIRDRKMFESSSK